MHNEDLVKERARVLRKLEPEAWCTYFPVEGRWQAHVWGKPLSGMCHSQLEAIEEAIHKLLAGDAPKKEIP